MKPEELSVLKYSDAGVNLYGNAILASSNLIAQNPKVVAAFLRATNRAIVETFANPAPSIAAMRQREPILDAKIELDRWAITAQYVGAADTRGARPGRHPQAHARAAGRRGGRGVRPQDQARRPTPSSTARCCRRAANACIQGMSPLLHRHTFPLRQQLDERDGRYLRKAIVWSHAGAPARQPALRRGRRLGRRRGAGRGLQQHRRDRRLHRPRRDQRGARAGRRAARRARNWPAPRSIRRASPA